ncbi:MAG: hypothetical protein RLZZ362_718, partial [Actinomycetota bacterium]
ASASAAAASGTQVAIPTEATGRFGKVCALGGVLLVMSLPPSQEIVVYWRPGCPFCSSLLRQLDKRGVPYHRVNIWQDPAAAATVRSIARGNETVPTVVVGPVGLVNPNIDAVLAAAAEHAPQSVPAGYEPRQPGRFAGWVQRTLSGSTDR